MPNARSTFSRRAMVQIASAFPLVAVADGVAPGIALAQTGYDRPGIKMTQILRGDLEGQGGQVQESIVTRAEFPPGLAAPLHYHPGAQEIFYVLEGTVTVEQEGSAAKSVGAGEAALTPAEVRHLVRNDSATVTARALVIHSRADKQKPLLVAATK